MDLKLIDDKGQAAATVAGSDALFGRDYNEPLIHQLVTAYQANARKRHAQAEGPRRHQQVAQEAVGAEGHRPRARGPGQQPAVARRRQDLPELAGREFLAEGEPQDVPRGHRVDPVAAAPRGPAVGHRRRSPSRRRRRSSSRRRSRRWASPGTLLIVTDKLDDNVFLSSRNLPDVLVLETREIDPVSLVRFNNVLLTKGAVAQFEEMLG